MSLTNAPNGNKAAGQLCLDSQFSVTLCNLYVCVCSERKLMVPSREDFALFFFNFFSGSNSMETVEINKSN